MEWFKRKTLIAGYEISHWIIVLGAIIIVLLIFQNFPRYEDGGIQNVGPVQVRTQPPKP